MRYIIQFELKSNGKWVQKQFPLGERSPLIGQVLREMRKQPEIRNVTYRNV